MTWKQNSETEQPGKSLDQPGTGGKNITGGLAEEITKDAFSEWYSERKVAQNIREGTPFFNGPSKIKPARRHSPSDLLQCSRKTVYKQLNAPEENSDPEGIFWFGSRFEEDVVLPFLEDIADSQGQYVTNSLWVDFEIETSVGPLTIKGETDPVIVDEDAQPFLLFEIKTKRSIEGLTHPNSHHKAQTHAYMKGLSEKYNRPISEAIILYGSRTTLDIKPIHIEFDQGFWRETVVDWAETHTTYRIDEELPPADPKYDWECEFCAYSQRCGQDLARYSDEDPIGLLPLFSGYPREKLVLYLEAYPEAKLTPTLAHQYPGLVDEYGVYDWRCKTCGGTYAWDNIHWNGDVESPSPCPDCSDDGPRGLLTGPAPSEQSIPSPKSAGENSNDK